MRFKAAYLAYRYRDVFSAFLEAGCKLGHNVFVIVQELSQNVAEALLVRGGLDFREVIEDVERSDVQLVHCQDGRIAAHDEGQVAESVDAMRNPDGQLP